MATPPNISLQRTAPCGLAAELGSFATRGSAGRWAIVGLCGMVALALGVMAEGQADRRPSIEVNETPTEYVMTVPVSRLILTIPKDGFVREPGAAKGPRYFYLDDKTRHIIVSGWFESDDGFKGIQELWVAEMKAWKQNKLPEPRDVTFPDLGDWKAVAYDTVIPNGVDCHIRASWVQAGTWIDLHLSMTAELPADEIRRKLRSVLSSIRVSEKPS
jgi:hypothetical protein